MKIKRLLSALAIIVLMVLSSCGQGQGSRTGSSNYGQNSRSKGTNRSTARQSSNLIIIDNSTSGGHTVKVGALGITSEKRVYGQRDTINLYDFADHFALAYNLISKGKVSFSLNVDNVLDTVFVLTPVVETGAKHSATLVSGKAAKLSSQANAIEKSDVRRWLYNNECKLNDEEILQMVSLMNTMNYKENAYWVEGSDIPVIKSFSGQKYSISTNLKADNYYLFATDNNKEVEEFVAEVISQEFPNAKSSTGSMDCFRPKDKGGYLVMFLIGIYKDWSKEIIPVGVVGIDAAAPFVYADSNRLSTLPSKEGDNEQVFSFSNPLCKIIVKDKNSMESLRGTLGVSTGQFRGDDANFVFTFSGDVESVSIKREIHRSYKRYFMSPETKTIKLSDKKSPFHYTYTLDLGIGDNYIPIKVTDKRGNVSEFTYNIETVPVEKEGQDINIDNNISIYN